MWRLVLLGLVSTACFAAEHWLEFKSGPFEVYTDAGARAGRQTLAKFEEFRFGLGQIVGEPDLKAPVPVRILLFKDARESAPWNLPEGVLRGRDRYGIVLTDGQEVPPAVFHAATRLFLDSNTARMPAIFERGLEDLFSTIQVSGIRITLGKPLPPAARNKDWARVHMLAVLPEYYGKLRVILYNLRRGVDIEPAYRNAVGKSPAEIEKETDQYLAAGSFQTTELNSRPLSVEHDFPEMPLDSRSVRLAQADLLHGDASRSAYVAMLNENVQVPEAHEGLGLLALRAGDRKGAREEFAAAIAADSQSADCYLQYARLETDRAKAAAALEKSVKLNPNVAEAHFLLAQHAPDVRHRIQQLKIATDLEPRNVTYWQDLAEGWLEMHNYPEAATAWRGAEQAATDPAVRERMRQARLAIDQQRLDYEAAERRRQEEAEQRELEALKVKAREHLHELEARANSGEPPEKPGTQVVPWWDGPRPTGKVSGVLKHVDCYGKEARLDIEGEDHRLTRLLIPDASEAAVMGGGARALACGPQKGQRVIVEYYPKQNARRATSGEVATITFQ